jgi:hypothetical protein
LTERDSAFERGKICLRQLPEFYVIVLVRLGQQSVSLSSVTLTKDCRSRPDFTKEFSDNADPLPYDQSN